MNKCCDQGYGRNDQTDRAALDRQNHEDRICLSRFEDPESQLLRSLRDHKKDQYKYDGIFDPHFPERNPKHGIRQPAHISHDHITGHNIDHTKHHDQCKNKTLESGSRHTVHSFSKKMTLTIAGPPDIRLAIFNVVFKNQYLFVMILYSMMWGLCQGHFHDKGTVLLSSFL